MRKITTYEIVCPTPEHDPGRLVDIQLIYDTSEPGFITLVITDLEDDEIARFNLVPWQISGLGEAITDLFIS